MDALKAQFERIRQQLAALSASQKMLVMTLVAVMVLTVMYWGHYAGNAEMVPVLDQVLTDDDIGPIDHQLELAGVPHSVSAGKVLVPADRKNEILANLMFARVLPQDTHSAFETMSKEINPFTSNTQMEMAYSNAISTELSSIIGQFPGVANARVIINGKNERKIEGSIPPSATVFITTKGGPENAKELVRAAADGVAHAVSGLSPSQISVIIDGASMKVPNSDNDPAAMTGDLMELREKREARLEQKIRNEFSYIAGLTVSVSCDVENATKEETSVAFDKSKTVVQPLKTSTVSEESSSASTASREPGASSNTGGANAPISLDSSGGGGGGSAPNTTTNTKEDDTNVVGMGRVDTVVHTPAGKDTAQSATVRVPGSYFTAIFKLRNPSATDAPQDFITAELASIRAGVKNVVGLKTEDALSVEPYSDIPVDLAMATGPVAQASTLNAVGGHAKEIGVAVLAVVSLLMMASMVRKSTPAQLAMGAMGGVAGGGLGGAAAIPVAGLSHLGSGESVAGEVGAGAAHWTAWRWMKTLCEPSRCSIRFQRWSMKTQMGPQIWLRNGSAELECAS